MLSLEIPSDQARYRPMPGGSDAWAPGGGYRRWAVVKTRDERGAIVAGIRVHVGGGRACAGETGCLAGRAATALEVSHPTLPVYGGLETTQLRRLLRLLAAAGFVLPTGVALLTSDSLS